MRSKLLLATLVLAVAVAGTSVAEPVRDAATRLVTGKQIKDRSIGLRELSRKARRALRGATGATGPQGPRGPAGTPGTSIFSGPIPSGVTVRGGLVLQGVANLNAPLETVVSLPAPAPVALDSAHVQFGDGFGNVALDEDPACSSNASADSPTAPPGKVCVYIIESNGNEISGESLGATVATRHAFRVKCTACLSVRAVWAYTAP